MAKTISIEGLSDEVSKILNSYVDEIADGTDEAAKKYSSVCARRIQSYAGKTFKTHNTDKPYAKSWTKTQTSKKRGKTSYTIYSKKSGLPHLLEHGHAKVSGGRVEGKPHIAPAAEKTIQEFQDAVKGVIEHATGGV